MTIFRGQFESMDDVRDAWGHVPPPCAEVIFAEYESSNYDGYARIVYVQDGEVFMVEDDHCSCHGLKNWKPERVTKAALAKFRWVKADPDLLAWCLG